MKKILLVFSVIGLLAAGCNVTKQPNSNSNQPPQQQTNQTPPPTPTQPSNNNTQGWKTYTNAQYGFEFSYPSAYTIKTSDKTNVTGQLFIVTITNSSNSANSGPASSISIGVWNNSKQLSLLDWATANSSFSNYGSGSLNSNFKNETLAGHQAISYSWVGMGNGKTVVIANNQTILLLDAGANSKTDQVWQDFDGVLSSLKFTK
jgi:hypothetical protein